MLQQMSVRLRAEHDLAGTTARILTDVIALHGAEFGDVQFALGDVLYLVGQRGFDAPFVRAFEKVDVSAGTVCARAYRRRAPVLIQDVGADPEFQPYRDTATRVGFRAVQSTPLIASNGDCVGVISTHFANLHTPTAIEMQILEAYARLSADHVQTLAQSPDFAPLVMSLNESVCRATMPEQVASDAAGLAAEPETGRAPRPPTASERSGFGQNDQ